MIISSGRRYIFVHAPKTGGTALSLALESRAMKDDILVGDTPKAVNRRGRLTDLTPSGRLWKHSTLADIEGIVDRAAFDSFLIVTLVRNPWDRLVSYYHWLRVQAWEHPAVTLAKASDFSTFLNTPMTVESLRNASYGTYVTDGAGVERTALFARIEALESDLVPLWDHLGFDLTPIGRVNASDRDRDWRTYYSDADVETVGMIAATDIARFGYTFDG